MFLFFQAEDGIRDLVRSRGLGDVYKRQIEVCHELKSMRPMFVEEPVPQDNVDAMKLVSDHVPFPIATGERLLSRWEFRTLLELSLIHI